MATGHQTKCPVCGKYFYRSETPFVEYKKRYYHKECYSVLKAEAKEEEALHEFIKDLFGVDFVSARIKKQINDMVANYGYKHSGILGTLKYWYEIKHNSLVKSNGGIGIVPFIYDQAKDYYERLYQAKIANLDIKQEDIEIKTTVVKIKKPISVFNSNRLIDFDKLEEGGE